MFRVSPFTFSSLTHNSRNIILFHFLVFSSTHSSHHTPALPVAFPGHRSPFPRICPSIGADISIHTYLPIGGAYALFISFSLPCGVRHPDTLAAEPEALRHHIMASLLPFVYAPFRARLPCWICRSLLMRRLVVVHLRTGPGAGGPSAGRLEFGDSNVPLLRRRLLPRPYPPAAHLAPLTPLANGFVMPPIAPPAAGLLRLRFTIRPNECPAWINLTAAGGVNPTFNPPDSRQDLIGGWIRSIPVPPTHPAGLDARVIKPSRAPSRDIILLPPFSRSPRNDYVSIFASHPFCADEKMLVLLHVRIACPRREPTSRVSYHPERDTREGSGVVPTTYKDATPVTEPPLADLIHAQQSMPSDLTEDDHKLRAARGFLARARSTPRKGGPNRNIPSLTTPSLPRHAVLSAGDLRLLATFPITLTPRQTIEELQRSRPHI
ncbi:hypothetical protein GGX14DRAFT_632651 [Mycena pura]|uniref:Uncharacterized protein n=1 Tax=Mycena pura TaxID=153505 RepID=A0AAD6VD91_9AGAR|nr:hypothetical protein GGX14DRAFT_632651 [Mycena pura]